MNKTLPLAEQMITSLPDVRQLEINLDTDEFMVLACDGIWNFMSSQEVCDYVTERLKANYSKLSQICEELFMHCLAPDSDGDGTGCDNMTCIIVTFKPFKACLVSKDTNNCLFKNINKTNGNSEENKINLKRHLENGSLNDDEDDFKLIKSSSNQDNSNSQNKKQKQSEEAAAS
jgi:protein phosphatase 1G